MPKDVEELRIAAMRLIAFLFLAVTTLAADSDACELFCGWGR